MAIAGPIFTVPGGSTTQLQYNNAGAFGGTSGVTWNGTNLLFATNQELQFRATGNKIYSSAANTLDILGATTTNIGVIAGDIAIGDATTLIAMKPQTDQKVDLGATSLRYRNLYIGNDIDVTDAGNFIFGTTTGTMIGTGATQLIGFFGATPVVQQATFTQTYSTASGTVATNTSNAVSTTAATNVAPYGYTTQGQADNIVTAINALRTDVDNVKKPLNSLIDKLQAYGLIA